MIANIKINNSMLRKLVTIVILIHFFVVDFSEASINIDKEYLNLIHTKEGFSKEKVKGLLNKHVLVLFIIMKRVLSVDGILKGESSKGNTIIIKDKYNTILKIPQEGIIIITNYSDFANYLESEKSLFNNLGSLMNNEYHIKGKITLLKKYETLKINIANINKGKLILKALQYIKSETVKNYKKDGGEIPDNCTIYQSEADFYNLLNTSTIKILKYEYTSDKMGDYIDLHITVNNPKLKEIYHLYSSKEGPYAQNQDCIIYENYIASMKRVFVKLAKVNK